MTKHNNNNNNNKIKGSSSSSSKSLQRRTSTESLISGVDDVDYDDPRLSSPELDEDDEGEVVAKVTDGIDAIALGGTDGNDGHHPTGGVEMTDGG